MTRGDGSGAGDGSISGRRPTIKDVAKHAGVSFKTVSRVINGNDKVNVEMRDAVLASMQVLDYRPHRAARALRTSRSYAIAMLSGGLVQPVDQAFVEGTRHFPSFLGELIIGCSWTCREAGYHLILEFLAYGDRTAAEARARALLDDLAPDGVLVSPPLSDLSWLLDIFDERRIPYARLLPGTELARGPVVSVDDFAAARDITRHLVELGHRQLAYIGGPPDHRAAAARQRGFEAALAECEGATAMIDHGDFFLAGGEEAAMRLLQADSRPTAIFAANDPMAVGAMKAAMRLGLEIPKDLSLVGFDDSAAAHVVTPALTTVRQPTADISRTATRVLLAAADAGTMPESRAYRLPYTVVIRESTAPPPA